MPLVKDVFYCYGFYTFLSYYISYLSARKSGCWEFINSILIYIKDVSQFAVDDISIGVSYYFAVSPFGNGVNFEWCRNVTSLVLMRKHHADSMRAIGVCSAWDNSYRNGSHSSTHAKRKQAHTKRKRFCSNLGVILQVLTDFCVRKFAKVLKFKDIAIVKKCEMRNYDFSNKKIQFICYYLDI